MATTRHYRRVYLALWNKEIDYDTDVIKCMLTSSAYSPNADTHDYLDDVTNEVSGTGYTPGGATLASKTAAYTAANSWGTQWAASTAFAAGDIVRPTTGNGFVYRAQVSGTTAGLQPTWPTTIGDEVTDSGVTWTCIGRGVFAIDCADVSWPSATISGIRYAVFYDDTPSTNATKPLICFVDFASDQQVTNGTFTVQIGSQGLILIPIE